MALLRYWFLLKKWVIYSRSEQQARPATEATRRDSATLYILPVVQRRITKEKYSKMIKGLKVCGEVLIPAGIL